MSLLALHLDYLTVCVFGLAGTLLGLAGLFLCGWRRWGWASPAACLALAAAGAAGAAARLEQGYWLPLLALAAVWGLFLFVRSPVAGWLARLVRTPRVQWALLLLAGPALMLWLGGRLADEAAPLFNPPPGLFDPEAVGLSELPGTTAVTDAGTTLPLFTPNLSAEGPPLVDEDTYLRQQRLKHGVLRLAPPGPEYNCHAWVFTGGRHWLRGEHVDQVLEDNGYRPTAAPRPGDVAVYRNGAAEVVHSGLVHTVSADGLVLIESKWGGLGRYLHSPSDHCYGGAVCTYYRSPRQGHLLTVNEVGPTLPAPPATKPLLGGG
jgi:hypothetical protein